LVDELGRRCFTVVPEPGRRIVREELENGGAALPWTDMAAFARRAIAAAHLDKAQTPEAGRWVFFDRSVIDAAAALAHVDGGRLRGFMLGCRYHHRVFFAPPWPEIFEGDAQRRHDYDEAVAEHDRLRVAYRALGYALIVLPKVEVAQRADFVLANLQATPH
jgi:predicted ATPase